MIIAKLALGIIIGYLIGSIPFGVIVGRRHAGVDVRQHGSGKMGTTNVLRTAGRKAAVAVGLLDFLKGAVSAIFAGLIVGSDSIEIAGVTIGIVAAQALGALAAVAGHIFPVFARFRGGRGVFTFFGGMAALAPVVAVFGGEIFLIGTLLSQYVSLGSISAAVSTYLILVPLTILNGFTLEYLVYALVGTLIIVVMHRDNISRLVTGRERKLGQKA